MRAGFGRLQAGPGDHHPGRAAIPPRQRDHGLTNARTGLPGDVILAPVAAASSTPLGSVAGSPAATLTPPARTWWARSYTITNGDMSAPRSTGDIPTTCAGAIPWDSCSAARVAIAQGNIIGAQPPRLLSGEINAGSDGRDQDAQRLPDPGLGQRQAAASPSVDRTTTPRCEP